jgi:glucose-6-phosphate isomerase
MSLWQRYQEHLCVVADLDLRLDVSRMRFAADFLARMEPAMQRAYVAMAELEGGAVANADENRMVGHYWLRAPDLAPSAAIRMAVESSLASIHAFARDVRAGKVRGASGPFRRAILVGIGGSALGPQLASSALRGPDGLSFAFVDNIDPDGLDRVLHDHRDALGETLVIVISKSGSTPEPRNGMLEIQAAYASAGLDFARHAVAVTSDGSQLHRQAEAWIARFPMWDWVGGRTSETSAVGLLPAALQGIDIDALLDGARSMDRATRSRVTAQNPAALLALMWHHAGDGRGKKDMVVLPYKDRLELFSRYLQQLVMESIGKERGLDGGVVHQGIAVYGNKGSTDQHAYVQQLREGIDNFFVTFVQVLRDRARPSMLVDDGATSGDFLLGFLLGTRHALHENGRESMTITIPEVSARTLGALIALYERAVGLYASLVGINAYHQPGVEAGKRAAAGVLALQARVLGFLKERRGSFLDADAVAQALGVADQAETVFHLLEHAAHNPDHGVVRRAEGASPFTARYAAS